MAIKLKNCCITGKDSIIIRPYSISENLDKLSHDGIDILCDNVYSACYGIVMSVDVDDDKYHVTVQYNESIVLRYCNLKYCNLNSGQVIHYRDNVGVADKYVHFEYCIPVMVDSSRCVRLSHTSYIKDDPMIILLGRDEMLNDFRDDLPIANYSELPYANIDEITESVIDEFSGGRGIE